MICIMERKGLATRMVKKNNN